MFEFVLLAEAERNSRRVRPHISRGKALPGYGAAVGLSRCPCALLRHHGPPPGRGGEDRGGTAIFKISV